MFHLVEDKSLELWFFKLLNSQFCVFLEILIKVVISLDGLVSEILNRKQNKLVLRYRLFASDYLHFGFVSISLDKPSISNCLVYLLLSG